MGESDWISECVKNSRGREPGIVLLCVPNATKTQRFLFTSSLCLCVSVFVSIYLLKRRNKLPPPPSVLLFSFFVGFFSVIS